MHADITITDEIYAPLLAQDIKNRIGGLGSKAAGKSKDQLEAYLHGLDQAELKNALILIAELFAK